MREGFFFFILVNLASSVHLFRPVFLSDDEINHNRVEREELGPCNEDDLMNFLAEIQVINPESVIKLATMSELQPSCTQVSQNLEKINSYLKTCVPPNQPDLYYQLIKGVESLHDKICVDSPYKKKFEGIHKCLHELRNDLEDCEGPADWNENSDNAAICKAYKDISDCYYIKTAEVCGQSAAVTTKELLLDTINSILTINCDNVKSSPVVKNPMPEEYMKKQGGNSAGIRPLLQFYTISILMLMVRIYN